MGVQYVCVLVCFGGSIAQDDHLRLLNVAV